MAPYPQRHPTASAHKARSVASSLASIFALQAQAFASLGVSLLVSSYPLIRCTRSATWPAVCQHALRHVATPKQVEALSPLIQADRSHRYGYAKAVHGLFPCGQWTEDCPPLHLRLSALVGLNSRGMVVTPYNRLDAPDVYARQAHHRTSGGSPPLLRSSSVDCVQGAKVQNLTHVYIFRKVGAGFARSLRRAGGGSCGALKGRSRPLRIPKPLLLSCFKFRSMQNHEI